MLEAGPGEVKISFGTSLLNPSRPSLSSRGDGVAGVGGFGEETAGGAGVAAAVGEGESAAFLAAAPVKGTEGAEGTEGEPAPFLVSVPGGPDAGAVFAARRSAVRTGVLSGASGVESLATASKSAVLSPLVVSGPGGGESSSGEMVLAPEIAEADATGGDVVADGAGWGLGAGEGKGVVETAGGTELPLERIGLKAPET